MPDLSRRRFLEVAACATAASCRRSGRAGPVSAPGTARVAGRAPVLFVSHGAPTVALEDDEYTAALGAFGDRCRDVDAVVVVSAHWQQPEPVRVTSSPRPETIHDFSGFPDALYRLRYPAPGHPTLAADIAGMLGGAGVRAAADPERGLDHGVWVPLRRMFPRADKPVIAVSLLGGVAPRDLLRAGRALAPLRDRNVLLVGSGGATHNLRRLRWDAPAGEPEPWAAAFDEWLAARAAALDLDALADYPRGAPDPRLAHPTTEHLDPVLVALGASSPGDPVTTLYQGIRFGTLSMRTFSIG